jgi:xanthine/uracil permease
MVQLFPIRLGLVIGYLLVTMTGPLNTKQDVLHMTLLLSLVSYPRFKLEYY